MRSLFDFTNSDRHFHWLDRLRLPSDLSPLEWISPKISFERAIAPLFSMGSIGSIGQADPPIRFGYSFGYNRSQRKERVTGLRKGAQLG